MTGVGSGGIFIVPAGTTEAVFNRDGKQPRAVELALRPSRAGTSLVLGGYQAVSMFSLKPICTNRSKTFAPMWEKCVIQSPPYWRVPPSMPQIYMTVRRAPRPG